MQTFLTSMPTGVGPRSDSGEIGIDHIDFSKYLIEAREQTTQLKQQHNNLDYDILGYSTFAVSKPAIPKDPMCSRVLKFVSVGLLTASS